MRSPHLFGIGSSAFQFESFADELNLAKCIRFR
jgi:hypothetical protein